MISQQQINDIIALLPECPKTAATLPCSVKNFVKVIPLIDDKILKTLHEALVTENQIIHFND